MIGESIESVVDVEEQGQEIEHLLDEVESCIFVNALPGNQNLQTTRLKRVMKGKCVHILVVSGSTQSFLDLSFVKNWNVTWKKVQNKP